MQETAPEKETDDSSSQADPESVRELLIKGGIDNKQRRKAWRTFLDIPDFTPTIAPSFNHKDYGQVVLDVKRSFQQIADPKFKEHRRDQLLKVIMSVLERHKDLHYYQGFQFIVSVVLTFAREPLAMLFLERLALGPLFPFFNETFQSLSSLLGLVFPLIALVDKELAAFFDDIEFDSTFALPYIVTWFTHQAPTREVALHCLDFFVVSNPLMPLYLVVALVLEKKDEVMKNAKDYEDATMILNDLITTGNIDRCIMRSIDIFQKFPPVLIFESDPKLTVSKDLSFIDPNVEYPYPFPSFPVAKALPASVYQKHLSQHKEDDKITTGIVSALAIVGTIGLRMLDI